MYYYNQELYHHGIKGQRWGIRRFQNKNGSLTPAGRKHRYVLSKEQTKNQLKEIGGLTIEIGKTFIKNKLLTAYGMGKYNWAKHTKHMSTGKAAVIGVLAGIGNTALAGMPFVIETGYKQYESKK